MKKHKQKKQREQQYCNIRIGKKDVAFQKINQRSFKVTISTAKKSMSMIVNLPFNFAIIEALNKKSELIENISVNAAMIALKSAFGEEKCQTA